MRVIPYLAVLAIAMLLDLSVTGGEITHATLRAAKNGGVQLVTTAKRIVERESGKEIARSNVAN